MTIVEMREVREGELFVLKPTSNIVYTRNHYDKSTRSFSASDTSDMMRERFFKSNKLVWLL